ncbi:MAG: hypothetical protein JSU68_13225 [Phycisphaerales bacterium]|nr:MAG: hypothetical protein JSU68_13225 [Phycisphaerales bacterium]
MATNRPSHAQRRVAPKLWPSLRTRPPIARLLWLLLACIHIPGIWFTWHAFTAQWDPSFLIRTVALSFSVAFLGFKVFDISWLRMPPGWRAQVSFVLIVILLHCGVVGRALNTELLNTGALDTPALLVFSVTASVVVLWRTALRRIWSRLRRKPTGGRVASTSRWSGAGALLARHYSDALLWPALAPRAPPGTRRPLYSI